MSEINVDVILPSALNVNVTSPTQSLAANVGIPGPQGPRGEKGNPTTINSLTAENIIISGADGNIVSTNGIETIYVSGNSGYFQSLIDTTNNNLSITGSTLQANINTLTNNLITSGNTLQTNINTVATNLNTTGNTLSTNLATTGSTLQTNINTLTTNLNTTGNTLSTNINTLTTNLNTTGNTLSTNINTLTTNLNTTGNTLSTNLATTGNTLSTNINTLTTNLNTTGNTLSTNINTLTTNLNTTGNTLSTNLATTGNTLSTNINTLTTNLNTTGNTLSTNLATTGSTLQTNINTLTTNLNTTGNTLSTNLATTGSTLQTNINTLTTNLNTTGNTLSTNLATTGSTLQTNINTLTTNLNTTGNTLSTNLATTGSTLQTNINTLTTNLNTTGNTLSTNLATTGSTLQTNINTLTTNLNTTGNTLSTNINTLTTNLNTTGNTLSTNINTLTTNLNTTGNTLSTNINTLTTNLNTTGNTLSKKIEDLSGVSVLTYGNQLILGNKTFNGNTTINNLFVTGTETIVNTSVLNVANPYLILNISGGASDGGIFFVTGSGLTGINDSGPIIGFDHSNKFKFGISTRNSDLSPLPDIASTQDIVAYSGVADNKFATIINLNSTGNDLQTQINTLSSKVIYTTGNQIISGNKTFLNNIEIQGTGIFNSLDLSNISNFDFSGTDINLINGNVNISGGTVYISGKPVLTGINLTPYALTTDLITTGNTLSTNLATTGSTLQTNINTLTTNLNTTGSGLQTQINTLANQVVYKTGDQTINGIKTFASNTYFTNDVNVAQNIRATGSVYFSDNLYVTGNLTVGGSINNPNLVLTKTKQTISGVKTFADNMSLNAYTGNGYDNTNLDYRLNIGGNVDENIGIQIDAYGINPPQILMRRARGIPTGLSGVLKDDILFNLQARGYVSGLNTYSTNSRAAIRLLAAEDWVGRPNYTGQGTYILLRSTNIGSGLAMDKVIIGTSGLNLLDGNIYISGKQVLTGINLSSYALSDQVVYKTGDQIISGNKTFANNINVSGSGIFNNLDLNNVDLLTLSGVDITITSGNVLLTNRPTVNGSGVLLIGEVITNVVYTTGRQTISGAKTFIDSGIFSLSGASPLSLPSNPLSIVGSGNTYLQLNIQNRATGTDASADLVITANNGTDGTNFINLGINNSGYNNSNFTNGSGYDGYLFIDGGDLDIGTRTSGKNIEFHVGGTTANKTIARIDSSGITIVSGTYRINNIPYNIFTTTFLSSNGNLTVGQNYISNVGAGYSSTFTDRLVPIMETCTARKASISLLNQGLGNNISAITGYFINTSTVPPQTGIINSSISAVVGSNQYTYTGAFSPPINISAGDNVVCSLFSNNTATNVRTFATIYLYN